MHDSYESYLMCILYNINTLDIDKMLADINSKEHFIFTIPGNYFFRIVS